LSKYCALFFSANELAVTGANEFANTFTTIKTVRIMTSTIVYKGDLRTEMTHLESGTVVFTDAPKDNHGKGEAFSPTDLVATGLGACMVSIMGIYARQQGLDIEGTHVAITKIMAANPRRIAEIKAVLTMPKRDFTDKDKKALERAALTCPVSQSLSADLVQDISFVW
jgi:putative redox protein